MVVLKAQRAFVVVVDNMMVPVEIELVEEIAEASYTVVLAVDTVEVVVEAGQGAKPELVFR